MRPPVGAALNGLYLLSLLLLLSLLVIHSPAFFGTFVAAVDTTTARPEPICDIEHCSRCESQTACAVCDDEYVKTNSSGCERWCQVEDCYMCDAYDPSTCILCNPGYKVQDGTQCVAFTYSDDLSSIRNGAAGSACSLTVVTATVGVALVAVAWVL